MTWTRPEDKLPESNSKVLCTVSYELYDKHYDEMVVSATFYNFDGCKIWNYDDFMVHEARNVTVHAWIPFPEAYKEIAEQLKEQKK